MSIHHILMSRITIIKMRLKLTGSLIAIEKIQFRILTSTIRGKFSERNYNTKDISKGRIVYAKAVQKTPMKYFNFRNQSI